MMRSYNLRGTNGSGKTFVARELLKMSRAKPDLWARPKKPESYHGELFGKKFVLLGSYETQCGGCDTIPSVARVAELLETYMKTSFEGVVFFEGLMISHMLGTVGAMQAKLGKSRNILAFLDTPLHICIQRVEARRRERGDDRPFDPRNIVADHPRVKSCMAKAIQQGYQVKTVDHETALENVLYDLQQLAEGDDL